MCSLRSSARISTSRLQQIFATATRFLIRSSSASSSRFLARCASSMFFSLGFSSSVPSIPTTSVSNRRDLFGIYFSRVFGLQTVAAHLDVPWFWGGTRFNIPQWLLIAMEQSKLWSHLRVHQTQGVAYLHEWVNPEKDGGGFFFYPNGTEGDAVVVPPVYNTALVLDGSTIVHGVDLFRPDRHLPDLSPNDPNELRYVGDEKWDLFDGQKVIKTYHTHDLRISLVWRARCFNSTEDRQKWANFKDEIQVEDVLETFQADLRKRGLLGATERPQSFELAMLILKHYVVYPLDVDPSWWIPVNYCQLPLLFQSDTVTRVLTALLSPICG
eukprot:m.452272 g.452272  ORF g.452272 m.452272 type:complete len:327 (+) comp56927_c0_seq1:620-1600(+)